MYIDLFQNLLRQTRFAFESNKPVVEKLPETVAGWCPWELGELLSRITECMDPHEQYLEVGTFCGRSLIYTLQNQKQLRAQVIDPLPDSMRVGDSNVWSHWNKNVDLFNIRNQITLHRSKLETFTGSIKDIGVAFIDGNHDSGHTYEALMKCEEYYADECMIIVDDYNIYGGGAQTPYPGHEIDIRAPVYTDVQNYLNDTDNAVAILDQTPWLNGQVYLHFTRIKK